MLRLSMKKKMIFVCFAALALLLAFSGCSDESTPPPTVNITIVSAPSHMYYSLTVFEEDARITSDVRGPMDTGLRGYANQALGVSLSFSLSVFPAGDYVLVLGVSDHMDGTGGKMYITGTSGTPDTRKAVAVDFSTPINFSEFLTNGGAGYELEEISSNFVNPPSP